MKIATSLTLLAIGAIFTFAITAHPSYLNLHVVGIVLMLVGIVGLLLPRRGQEGWLRRRMLVRKGARGPVVDQLEETQYPPYISINPASPPGPDDTENAPGPRPTAVPDPPAEGTQAGETEVIEEYLQE